MSCLFLYARKDDSMKKKYKVTSILWSFETGKEEAKTIDYLQNGFVSVREYVESLAEPIKIDGTKYDDCLISIVEYDDTGKEFFADSIWITEVYDGEIFID